jgi:RNA polymerase sigma factor (sigma-70 family)
MGARPLETVLRRLGTDGRSDRELLERFRSSRDEAAFAALVHRHQHMVRSVCRSVLRHCQDSEDACQAVFLVLAKKAESIRDGNAVAAWLHGVAFRIASQARKRAARRRLCERRAATVEASPGDDLSWREVQCVLHEELQRLPQKYRLPLIACCLEGRTRDEAARQLGCTFGALKGMLDRGRELLRKRLERRGVTLAAALATITLTQDSMAANCAATAKAALAFAAKQATELTSVHAAAMAEAALKSTTALRATVAAVLLLGVVAIGAAGYSSFPSSNAPVQEQKPAIADAEPPKPKVDRFSDPLPPGAVVRMGTSRLRHLDRVSAVAFSPNGKILASGGGDHLIRLWEPATGRPIRLLAGHVTTINAIAFSPDGKILASAGSDQTVRLWDPDKGREICDPIPAFSSFVAFAPTGNLLAFDGRSFNPRGGDEPSRVRLWDYAAGKEVRSWIAPHNTSTASISPDGKVLATGAWDERDNAIRFWDIATGKELRRCTGIRGSVACVTFAPDGKTLASGSRGFDQKTGEWFGGVKIWDTDDGKELCNIPAECLAYSVQYAPDGRTLMVSDDNGKTTFWDFADLNAPRRVWEDATGGRYLALSSDGRLLARGKGAAVQILDVATRTLTPPHAGHTGEIKFIAFSPDGRRLISAGESVHEWDAVTGKHLRELPAPLHVTRGGGRGLYSAALTPDGKALVTGSCEGTVLWNLASGKPLRSFDVEHGYARAAAISPDGKTLITATELQTPVVTNGVHGIRSGREDFLRVWDVETGKEVRQLGKQPWVRSLVFSPNGKLLGTTSDSWSIQVWDIATEKRITIYELQSVKASHYDVLAFSPDSNLLAAGDLEGGVQIWDIATRKEVRRFPGHRSWITATAFSPNGKTLLSASGDQSLRLWDVPTGKLLHEIRGHRDEVRAAAFSPDGKRIASASADTNILVWDLAALGAQTGEVTPAPAAEELQAVWYGLGARHQEGDRSARQLIAVPEAAITYLKERLKQEPPHNEKIKTLIADLENDSFKAREHASRELEELGEAAIPALRRASADSPSPEVRRRAERLLNAYWDKLAQDQQPITGQLRMARTATVLARIGTPEANKLLLSLREDPFFQLSLHADNRRRLSRDTTELEGVFYGVIKNLEANGTPDARQLLKMIADGALSDHLTREAKSALERLARLTGP